MMNHMLIATPNTSEIQKTVFTMRNYKIPRLDGMIVLFYKTYWGLVKEAIVYKVNFFSTVKLRQAYNHTFLALFAM